MAEAIHHVARGLIAELEARFPYAAALFSGASGVRIGDTGREQTASEEPPCAFLLKCMIRLLSSAPRRISS